MKGKRYAIVDLETTGGRATRDKITEIAIVLHDGEQILDTYETLVNPETYIPYGITQLTGITQEMVQDAPKFYEVAKKVVEMTEGAIFVAHNVRFDYGFLREEFGRLGYTFSRRQLCTVRLSRKAFPGLGSYSLDNLIRYMGIQVEARHRAMGDAMATAELFRRIMASQENEQTATDMVNLGLKESRLPKSFNLEKVHQLPEACGVYYFHDEAGNVLYVGKSINIKKRIAEHFADQTRKAAKLQQHTHDITYELTGSELVALLLESYEIKRLRPPVNRAQRLRSFPYAIHRFYDEAGYLRFDVVKVTAKTRNQYQIVSEHPKIGNARGKLEMIFREYELCARLCALQNGTGPCFHYHIKQCHGACAGIEEVTSYNARAEEAIERLSTVFDEDFFILDQGREREEHAVVYVENGQYMGFGYIDLEKANDLQALRDAIKQYPGNPETNRIIQRFISQNKRARVLKL
mgnify:CR=1 FL=1